MIKATLILLSLVLAVFWVWGRIIPHRITTNAYFNRGPDKVIQLTFRKYPFPRELHWSGVSPVYGGFTKDPHMSRTELISGVILQTDGQKIPYQIQGFSTNKYFDNPDLATSELALKVDGETYRIDTPQFDFFDMTEPHSIIPIGNNAATLWVYFPFANGPDGAYDPAIVQFPRREPNSRTTIVFASQKNEWKRIIATIREANPQVSVFLNLCESGFNPKQLFLELTSSPCK